MTTIAPSTPAQEAIGALEGLEPLDAPARALADAVRASVPGGPVKDALSGTWLGHTLHPLLTDLPIGTWTSAVLLDWLGGDGAAGAADRLIALGLAFSAPAAATGMTEWADSEAASDGVRRVGLVHAATNTAATALFGASLAARRRGSRGAGRALALAGAGVLGAGGWLGGHLAYAQGVGVDRTVFEEPAGEWRPVLPAAELADDRPVRAAVDGVPVVLVRHGGEVHALSDRCSHRGGSLADGELADGCITCPLHGSAFRLSDGAVERGPAAYPQPVWATRESGGTIELCRA